MSRDYDRDRPRIPAIINTEAVARRLDLTGETTMVNGTLYYHSENGEMLGFDRKQNRYVQTTVPSHFESRAAA